MTQIEFRFTDAQSKQFRDFIKFCARNHKSATIVFGTTMFERGGHVVVEFSKMSSLNAYVRWAARNKVHFVSVKFEGKKSKSRRGK